MPHKAVCFDLFGTLIGHFSRSQFDRVIRQIADSVSVPFELLWEQMGNKQGVEIGRFASLEEFYEYLFKDRLSIDVTRCQVTQMAQYHYLYISQELKAEPNVLESLQVLRDIGLKIGLITNCGPDVPTLWDDSPLSPLIDVPVFSCKVKLKKPNPEIYDLACARLGVSPNKCIYVGDGSGEELAGAARVGMYPVLKRIDLGDVYDPDRKDVERWTGPEISTVSEIVEVIGSMDKPSR